MTALLDILLYLLIIGIALTIIAILLYGIHNLIVCIRRANARLIWRTVAKHAKPTQGRKNR